MQLSKKKRNLALIFVSFTMGMLYFIPYIRFTFYDQTLEVFGINNTQMGILGSVYGLIAICGYFVSGILCNRFEPRKLLALSSAATGAITLWLAQIPSFGSLVAIYAMYSVFTIATAWSPYMVICRSLGSEEEQSRIFGISDALRNVFSALAGFAFIWLFSLFANIYVGYKGMLLVSVGLYFIFAVLCFVILPNVNKETAVETETADNKAKLSDVLKTPGVWLMGIFIFSCYNAVVTQANYLGTFTTQLGVDVTISSSLAIVRAYVLSVLAGLLGGYILDKAKSRVVALGIMAGLLAVSCILVPLLETSMWITVVLTMFISMFAMILLATYWSIMGDCGIPMEYTALASGLISCIAYIPDAYVTVLIGRWLDADISTGFTKMFVWMAAWAVIAVIMAAVIYKREKKMQK